ncbi:MAG: peptidylprolyl isomerase [Bacteroidota bacterium]
MPRLLLPALALLLAAAPTRAQIAPGTVLDGIVAVVGDQIVLRSEVDALSEQAAQGQPVSDDLWSRALDDLVRQNVLVVHAQRDTTLTVTDQMVEEQLDVQIQQLVQQVGSESALEAYYNRTTDEIKALFREDTRKQIMAERFRGNRLRNVTVTPAEVRAWLDQIPGDERPIVPEIVRVAHIVKIPSASEEAQQQARDFAGSLRDSILTEAATLEDLARRHSDDPGSGSRGGLIENIELRLLVPEFAAVAGSIEPGEISQVFETPFGYHVLRVGSRAAGRVTFNHILVSVDIGENAGERAREDLLAIRDSILTQNVSFEALARRNSQDEFSAPRGGFVSDPRTGERDLRLDALGPEWALAVDSLEVGEVSEPAPVRLLDATGTQALHIVLLQKRTPEQQLSVETHYTLLSQYALNDKRREVFATWVNRLQQDVYVDIRSDRYVPEADV